MIMVTGALVASVFVSGCAAHDVADDPTQASEQPGAPVQVTDLLGRQVTVPADIDAVAAIGSGSLRIVVYADAADMVVGIEQSETKAPIARPYTLAHPELLELPIIGAGGPDSAPDAEALASAAPDVIFAAQMLDAVSADKLQQATGIPVVVLSYGDLGNFSDDFFTSLDLAGTVLGKAERTDAVVEFIEDALDDLAARTANIPEAEQPTVFVGALGYKGLHGLESTQARYAPFSALRVRSVTAGLQQSGSVMIDKEQLLTWDPDYLFVDLSGLSLVREDVRTNGALYRGLSAVQNSTVHAQLPFNNYSTNVGTALADAYYIGTLLYPEQFAEVDPALRADEFYTFLVGAPVYGQLTALYGPFGPVDLLLAD